MNHVRWAAWGVVDIEKLERMQRRNYIKRARAELEEQGIALECGGSKTTPWYSIILPPTDGKTIPKHSAGGVGAFKKVCEWLLLQTGEHPENTA